MPKLEARPTATVTTTKEIKLDARLEKKLKGRLESYATLKAERDAIDAAMEDEKKAIGLLREKTGEQSIKLGKFTVTQVQGVSSTLDKMKLIQLGCAAAWIEEATVTKPKKPYELISVEKEKA